MRRTIPSLLAAFAGAALFCFTSLANAQVTPLLGYCRPLVAPCNLGSCGTSTCTQLDKGYAGPGFGNTSSSRSVEVGLGLFVPPGADVQAEIAATERIEICTVFQGGSQCPGGAFVIYDKNGGGFLSSIDPNSVGKGLGSLLPNVKVPLPLDWAGGLIDLSQFGFFLKVTPGKPTDALNAATFGSCWNWSELASDDQFEIWGVNPPHLAFDFIDTCTKGAQMNWHNAPGLSPTASVCLTPARAEYVRKVMVSENAAQRDRVQEVVPEAQRIQAWVNGQAGGKFRPMRVFLGPHTAGGQHEWGGYRANVGALNTIDPTMPPSQTINGDLRLLTHEFFHSLQGAWGREQCQTDAHLQNFTSEGMASSVEINLCLQGFPNAPATDCVSAGKLKNTSQGIYNKYLFQNPKLNVLQQSYASVVFWRYVQEQFSYPLSPPNNAHTGAVQSQFERAPNADNLEPKLRQFSDEGVDLLGHLFLAYAAEANKNESTLDILSSALDTLLGRDLDEVVLDLHTAMVLKDYTDQDPRWRFDWVHLDGYQATTRLALGKPFRVPGDLYGGTCGTGPAGTPICDGLVRAKREHDAWMILGFAQQAVRDLLAPPPAPGVASAVPVGLGTYAAAYMSVSPAPGWVGKNLEVRADVLSGTPAPRFRVFRIVGTDGGPLTPVPACGTDPSFRCTLYNTKGSSARVMKQAVPITADTREVLLVASSGAGPASFHWSFGEVQPVVKIIEPTELVTAQVGSAAARRSFLAKVTYRDALSPLKPLGLAKSDVTIRIPNCATGGSCQLSPSDFAFLGLSGGNVWLVVTLPQSFYPSGSGDLNFEVEINGAVATEFDALPFGTGGTEAVMLALDKSGSMGLFGGTKLTAAKLAGGAIIQSLMPPPGSLPSSLAGIVSFNEDADTSLSGTGIAPVHAGTLPGFQVAIDALVAGGGTSIGDGLLESQFALAIAFDPPAIFAPDRQSIAVLSDGVNTDEHPPSVYLTQKSDPEGDGNGNWTGRITRVTRKNAGLVRPRVSAVAIGQDADLSELDLVTRMTDGTLVYLPGPEATTTLLSATLDFGDAMSAAYGAVSDYDRIATARTRGGIDPPAAFVVEAGARELRVLVASAVPEAAQGSLLSPSGAPFPPVVEDPQGRSAAYRVADPEPGIWTLSTSIIDGVTAPIVFVEASVKSPTQLFVAADVAEVLPAPDDLDLLGPQHLSASVGTDVFIRAVPWELGAMTDCHGSARVTLPSGVDRVVTLRDDGRGGDAMPGDGVYERLFSETGEAGLYAVRIDVTCSSAASGGIVRREKSTSFLMHGAADVDANGIADEWETFYGLASHPPHDADGDGLSNALEFRHGTNPIWSDSDGGGESDGSEVAGGRDPRDPGDDIVSAPVLVPIPGNARVYLPLARNLNGATLEVERAPAAEGPFTPRGNLQRVGDSFALDAGMLNDIPICYRVRAVGDATTAWSMPACVTPRIDPFAPRVTFTAAPTRTHGRNVSVELGIDDLPAHSDGPPLPVDLGVVATGTTEVRVWFGAGAADGVAWQPASAQLDLRLPDQDVTVVQVQARDLAGNVSLPASAIITRPLLTAVDRAIALDEAAQDRLEAGDLPGARALIQQSLAELAQSITAAVKRIAGSNGPNADAVYVLTTLNKIKALKHSALALLKPQTLGKGTAALDEALSLELALAKFADEKGIGL